MAIASHQRPIAFKGRVLRYEEPAGLSGVPMGSQIWHEGLERAARVAHIAEQLEKEGWRPGIDTCSYRLGRNPWSSEVWPTVNQILWPELWVHPSMVAMELIRLSRQRVLVAVWSS